MIIAVLTDAPRAERAGQVFGLAIGLAFGLWILPIVISNSGRRKYGSFPSAGRLRLLLGAVVLVAAVAFGVVIYMGQ